MQSLHKAAAKSALSLRSAATPRANQQLRRFAEARPTSPQTENVPATARQTLTQPMKERSTHSQTQEDLLLKAAGLSHLSGAQRALPRRPPQKVSPYLIPVTLLCFISVPPVCYYYWEYRKQHMHDVRVEKLAEMRKRHGFTDN